MKEKKVAEDWSKTEGPKKKDDFLNKFSRNKDSDKRLKKKHQLK